MYIIIGVYCYSVIFFIVLYSWRFLDRKQSFYSTLIIILPLSVLIPQHIQAQCIFCMKFLDICSRYQHCIWLLIQTALESEGVLSLNLMMCFHLLFLKSELLITHWIQVHKKNTQHNKTKIRRCKQNSQNQNTWEYLEGLPTQFREKELKCMGYDFKSVQNG